MSSGIGFVLFIGGVIVLGVVVPKWLQLRRAEIIRTYRWPSGLLKRLEKHHPGFERKDSALVSRGLRQFFLAYLMSGKRHVSMPSQVADDLWHEFILYTREYDAFCRRAFGGFLHHTPAVVLSEHRKSNEGLRRVWWYCCKYENIDPVSPTRLPLLFALDSKLKIANGFVYHPDCEDAAQERQRRRRIAAAISQIRRSTAVRTGLAIAAATQAVIAAATAVVGATGAAAAAAGIEDSRHCEPTSLEQRRLLDLLDAEVGVDGAYGLHAAPFVAVARDRKQIIRRGRIMPVRQRRRRRHADGGDLAVGAFEPHRRMDVVVAVQDQFDAAPLQHGAERLRIR